jgi:flavin-dependent dehydrogenase
MENYDVIVIGGGTAGCSAAYNASKHGLKTLLIEKSGCLGGSMTNGLVVPVMQTGANSLNTDFYKKLIAEMHKLGGQITYQNNQGWFNPELLKICLDKILIEAGVKILFNTEIENAKIINTW